MEERELEQCQKEKHIFVRAGFPYPQYPLHTPLTPETPGMTSTPQKPPTPERGKGRGHMKITQGLPLTITRSRDAKTGHDNHIFSEGYLSRHS